MWAFAWMYWRKGRKSFVKMGALTLDISNRVPSWYKRVDLGVLYYYKAEEILRVFRSVSQLILLIIPTNTQIVCLQMFFSGIQNFKRTYNDRR